MQDYNMREKILFLFAFAFILFTSVVVSAANVQFNITTCDNCKVSVTMLKPGNTYYFVDSFSGNTDAFGKFSRIFQTEEAELKYIVTVKDGEGNTKYTEKIDKKSTSEGVDLYLGVSKPEPIVETPAVNVTNTTASANITGVDVTVENVTTDSSGGITANVISESLKKVPVWAYYILIGVVIIGILVFYFWKNGFPLPSIGKSSSFSSPSSSNEIKSSVSGKKSLYSSSSVSALENQVNEAEAKIKEARAQINRMKNQDKIRQMEARLEKERRELDKLRSGDD